MGLSIIKGSRFARSPRDGLPGPVLICMLEKYIFECIALTCGSPVKACAAMGSRHDMSCRWEQDTALLRAYGAGISACAPRGVLAFLQSLLWLRSLHDAWRSLGSRKAAVPLTSAREKRHGPAAPWGTSSAPARGGTKDRLRPRRQLLQGLPVITQWSDSSTYTYLTTIT